MAVDVEIECIVPDGSDPNRTIDKVGGTGGGGWCITVAEAIRLIQTGVNTFYTYGGGQYARVIARPRSNPYYLTTEPDTTTENNLLKLPRCPLS